MSEKRLFKCVLSRDKRQVDVDNGNEIRLGRTPDGVFQAIEMNLKWHDEVDEQHLQEHMIVPS
jgi:hypothetical protein